MSSAIPSVVPAWVEQLIGDKTVRILDLRENGPDGADPYDSGHIPEAIRLDITRVFSRSKGVESRGGTLGVSLVEFAGAMASHGIGDEHYVIVYDEQGGGRSRDLVRTLHRFGHYAAAAIDGGYARWTDEGRTVEVTFREASPASFTAREQR